MFAMNGLAPRIEERNSAFKQPPFHSRFSVSLIPKDIPGSFCEFLFFCLNRSPKPALAGLLCLWLAPSSHTSQKQRCMRHPTRELLAGGRSETAKIENCKTNLECPLQSTKPKNGAGQEAVKRQACLILIPAPDVAGPLNLREKTAATVLPRTRKPVPNELREESRRARIFSR